MIVESTDSAINKVIDYSKELLELEDKIEDIKRDITETKQNWKEEGVNVTLVTSVIHEIKSLRKKGKSEKFEKELIREHLMKGLGIEG